MNRSSKVLEEKPRQKGELLIQIFGVLLIALAVLMAVSLISHSPEDPPNSSRPPELTQNMAGWIGAQLSYHLFFFVGYGAYALVALVLFWGWNRFRRSAVISLVWRSVTLLVMMVLYCGATGVPSRGRTHMAFRWGGWLGVTLSSAFLVPYLGRIGSYILLGTLLLVVLMVATDIPFSRIPDLVVRIGLGLRAGVMGVVRGGSAFVLGIAGRTVAGWTQWQKRRKTRLANRREKAREAPAVVVQEAALSAAGAEPRLSLCDDLPVPSGEVEDEEEAVEDGWETQPDAPEIVQPHVEAPAAPRPRKRSRTDAKAEVEYNLPDLDLLDDPPEEDGTLDREYLLEGAQTLERSLSSFGIDGKVIQVNPGPVITCYEVEPPPGVKVNRIVNLADDLALVMKARSIRIQAPIPGKAAVGVEVSNPKPAVVYLKEILESQTFQKSDSKLMLVLGKTASGEPFCTDLTDMPHLLIAGATGSGKSICINALISSILFRSTPEEVRFIMVDPKMLELSIYDNIPHLLAPVVTEPKKASEALKWAVAEMEDRYRTMSRYSVRNIVDYNRKLDRLRDQAKSEEDRQAAPERLPYIVVIIDELADLMMTAPGDIEDSLARLAQMARAVGIHLIVATQRPSVNVITGTIKANFPSRIAFRVASKVDSRTILDANGAERLLGRGDMLFLPPGRPEPIRLHGAYTSTDEAERLVGWVCSQGMELEHVDIAGNDGELTITDGGRDERFDEAMRLVITHQQGSASLLQRRMKVGYARAGRLIDELEQAGVVGPSDGSSKAREVLVDVAYLESLEREDLELEDT